MSTIILPVASKGGGVPSDNVPISLFCATVDTNAFTLVAIVEFLQLKDVVKLLTVLSRKEAKEGGDRIIMHQPVMINVGRIEELIAAAWAKKETPRFDSSYSDTVQPSAFVCTRYGDAERRVVAPWLSKVFRMVQTLPESFELEETTEPTTPTNRFSTAEEEYNPSLKSFIKDRGPSYALTNTSSSTGTTLFSASWDTVTRSGTIPFAFCLEVPTANCSFTGVHLSRYIDSTYPRPPCALTSLLCCGNCKALMQTCNQCANSCNCPTLDCESVGPLCPDCRITDETTGELVGCVLCTFICGICSSEVAAQRKAFCADETCDLNALQDTCLECFAGLGATDDDLVGVTFSRCEYGCCYRRMCSRCTVTCDGGTGQDERKFKACPEKPSCREHFDTPGEQGATCVQCNRSACFGCFLPGPRHSACGVFWCESCNQPKCGQLNGERSFAKACTTFDLCSKCGLMVCLECKLSDTGPYRQAKCRNCVRRRK